MESRENMIDRQDAAPLLQELREGRVLEKWQRCFCGIANVFLCCVDNHGFPLTEFEGKKEEVARIKRVIDEEQLQNMLLRVSESTLEDQAIETTQYPNLRLAVVSVRIGKEPAINWLACGIICDAEDEQEYENPPLDGFTCTISEKQFSKAVDTLRTVTDALLKERLSAISAKAESRRSHIVERNAGERLKRSEKLNEIMRILESGEPDEDIMYAMLKAAGEFLDLDVAALYCIQENEEKPEIAVQWCGQEKEWEVEEKSGNSPLLKTEKTLVLSLSSLTGYAEKEELQALGFQAVILIPIVVNGVAIWRACFGERVKERVWELGEIQFLNDCVKSLQTALTKTGSDNGARKDENYTETILEHMKFGVYVRDCATGKFLYANKNMRSSFKKELRNGSMNRFLNQNVKAEGGRGEAYYAAKERWYDIYHEKIRWTDGGEAFLDILYDTTDKKNYEKKMEQLARTDFLTGLSNRLCCEQDLEEYVKKAREGNNSGILLYMDLDNFKRINDSLGHQYGDILLKTVAEKLAQIESIKNTCYRIGGDEFVLIIPPESYDNGEKIIASVKKIFAGPQVLKEVECYCTASMGGVKFPVEGDHIQELIKKADMAMYKAKKKGKNQFAWYSGSVSSDSREKEDMEQSMRDAVKRMRQEFEIYFQPIINIKEKEHPCVGAEALVRWNNAQLGFLLPSEFMPIAEYLGLINPIGSYVLKEACRCCKAWNDHGYPEYKVSVNFSMAQLLQPDIGQIIEKAVKETGINPQNLILEIAEGLAVRHTERMIKITGELKKLGVMVALDNFGNGEFSLNRVREFPFDIFKIDRNYIRDLEKDIYARSFVRMAGELVETIGRKLYAEGVESQAQCDILSSLPVDLVQGYYFERPMERKAFEEKYAPENSAL